MQTHLLERKRYQTLAGISSQDSVLLDELDLNEISSSDIKIPKKYFIETLHPKFWKDGALKPEIRLVLLHIATDFLEYLKIEALVNDVVITGSIA